MNKKNLILVGAFTLIVLAVFVMWASEDVEAATDWPEGPITKNTQWDLKGSPYIVDGMVTVQKDVKLTIKPGVEVFFNSEEDTDFTGYGITVHGDLAARDVTFTKHPANTRDTAWAGLAFEGTSDIDFVSNVISSAAVGIYIVDSYDITISDSKITGCLDAGVLVDYGPSQSREIDILGCEIVGNSNMGVEFRSVYDSEISDCDISENLVTNVLLNSIGKGIITHDVLLSNNLIRAWESTWYFTSNGIEIYGASDIVVDGCTILKNNQFGIYVSDSELTVSETEIAFSTHWYGLFAWSTDLTLLGNNFHDNSHSIWAAGGCAVFSSGNSFKDDYKGVVVYHSRLYMEYDNMNKVMHGVSAYYDTTVRIYNCDMKGSEDSGVGIMLSEAVKLHLTESRISDYFYGVMVENTPETYIVDNVFVHNRNVAISVGTNFMDITVRVESNLINQGGGGIFIGGGLHTVHCTGDIIKDNIINNVEYGIWVNYCEIPIVNNQMNHASLYGIHIKTASPLVRNNVVRNSAIGIYVEWWSYPEIFQNRINNCQWGIYVAFLSEGYIAGNHISVGNVGIVCDAGCYISARMNYIRGMRNQGILVYHGRADISNNMIRKCKEGIYLYWTFGSVTDNEITHSNIGLVVHSSKVLISSNTFRKNKTDIRFIH